MTIARRRWARAGLLVAGYAAVTLWITWPLPTRLGTSLAGDYGDPAFVSWVMAWVADHLTAVLRGDPAAWDAMWDAPIFWPERSTLAYSEHFLAQSLQSLPIWWATRNPLLGYNVVYLATMTLTMAAAHGLAVRLSGRPLAGLVAALTCALNDYRTFWSLGHLHTLSIHWWIFGLWGLDVFIATGSRPALAGATAALIALHFSSNYLMAFCAPFTALFAVWSLARHGRLGDVGRWSGVVAAGLASVLAVLPVVLRYLATRDGLGFSRSLAETTASSASFAAYGQALPWIAPLVLLALVGALAPSVRDQVSRRARLGLLAMAAVAVVLSFGPVISLDGQTYPGPYLLLRYVPGFEGLRVPHRFVAIAATLLSLLAGFGAAWLARWRVAPVAVAVAVALVTRTGWQPLFPIDGVLTFAPLAAPPPYLRPAAVTPAIYRFLTTAPAGAVLAELPFGDLGYEVRYTFFTQAHRRRTLNGYSGVLPPSYEARVRVLTAPLADPDAAWQALATASHVIVHSAAWPDDTGARVTAWLEGHGAHELVEVEGARLYALPPH